MKTPKSDQPITKSEFNQYVCGINVWRNMPEIKRASSYNGQIRESINGGKYECISMSRNSVYIVQTWNA